MRACRARRRAAQSSKPGAGRQSPCRGVRRGAAKMNKVSTCPRAGRRHLLIVARRETAAARFATRTSHPVDAGPRRVGPAWLGVVSGGRAGPVDRRPTSEDAPDRVRPGDSSPGRAFLGYGGLGISAGVAGREHAIRGVGRLRGPLWGRPSPASLRLTHSRPTPPRRSPQTSCARALVVGAGAAEVVSGLGTELEWALSRVCLGVGLRRRPIDVNH